MLLQSDPKVCANALEFIGEVYKVIDDNLWNLIGKINDKQKTIIENRIKMINKKDSSILNTSINSRSMNDPMRRSIT